MSGERRSRRLGALGQAGLPGVAWMRMGGWLLLGPGRGRRDDEEGWVALGLIMALGPGRGRRDDGGGCWAGWGRRANRGRGWRVLAMTSMLAMQSVLAVLTGQAGT